MRLAIHLGDVPVGAMTRREGRTSFAFDDAYLSMTERPVLGRWFEDQLMDGFEYGEPGSRLPPFFQNYLPEQGSALRAMLARHAGVRTRDEFALLAALGADLPGAAVAVRDGSDRGDADLRAPRSQLPAETDRLRFSLAGMQLKFSMVLGQGRFTLPMKGLGGRWIVKLPDPQYPYVPRNEASMLMWAREAGITVPEARLVPLTDVELPEHLVFTEPEALAVERFDRLSTGGRVHQEDFAQVVNLRPDEKYDRLSYASVAKIVRVVCGEEDYEEVLRRLVFVVMSANADAHAKNWSLVYPDRRRARLAPAYDLVCTRAYPQTDTRLALLLGKQKEFERVTKRDFERLAEKVGADARRSAEVVEMAASATRGAWSRLRLALPLEPSVRVAVDTHLAAIQL